MNFVYGGLDAFWIDRWARRLLLPSFFAVQMAICFFPRSGQASIAASDHTGIRCSTVCARAAPRVRVAGNAPVRLNRTCSPEDLTKGKA